MGEQLFVKRFLWFDREVRGAKYPNATTLKKKFEISEKTAQRSIDYFRDRMDAPLEYSRDHNGYYYDKPFFLPSLHLSQDEVVALLVARQLLVDLEAGSLGREAELVTQKLGALLAANLPGQVSLDQAFSLRWQGHYKVEAKIFDAVCKSLLGPHLLEMTYVAGYSGSTTTRTVEPHHLLNYRGTWHLIAYCRTRNEWRNFNLSRILSCKVQKETFSLRPAEEWQPQIGGAFGIFQGREVYPVVLLFSAERAPLVRDRKYHPDQSLEELPDGRVKLTVPVAHDFEIMMEILGHGAEVEVLAPASLREKVHEEIRRMAKKLSPVGR